MLMFTDESEENRYYAQINRERELMEFADGCLFGRAPTALDANGEIVITGPVDGVVVEVVLVESCNCEPECWWYDGAHRAPTTGFGVTTEIRVQVAS